MSLSEKPPNSKPRSPHEVVILQCLESIHSQAKKLRLPYDKELVEKRIRSLQPGVLTIETVDRIVRGQIASMQVKHNRLSIFASPVPSPSSGEGNLKP